jgi:hypothetical protein
MEKRDALSMFLIVICFRIRLRRKSLLLIR